MWFSILFRSPSLISRIANDLMVSARHRINSLVKGLIEWNLVGLNAGELSSLDCSAFVLSILGVSLCLSKTVHTHPFISTLYIRSKISPRSPCFSRALPLIVKIFPPHSFRTGQGKIGYVLPRPFSDAPSRSSPSSPLRDSTRPQSSLLLIRAASCSLLH